MAIEKILHQTWVGDKPRPKKWMDTWKDMHPDWEYKIWDNNTIKELDIQCKEQFDYYWERKMWHGVADIIRYHALYKFGGFQPGADSICLNKIDELAEFDLLTIKTYSERKEDWQRMDGEPEDGQTIHFLNREDPIHHGSVTPIHGSIKGHWFLKALIDEISKKKKLEKPYISTGNMFCKEMIKKYKPDIKILPMHTFVPERTARTKPPRNYKYIGKEKVYSCHLFGTTNNLY